MKKTITLIGALMFISLASFAQGFYTVNWDLSTGIGTTYNHISKSSLRGISIDSRKFYTPNISYGVSFGWNVFHESFEGTFEKGSTATTGKQIRTINSFPLMATGHYYIDEDKEDISFYLGTGIGTYIMEQRTDMGLYSVGSGYKWHFGLQPQVGMLIPINPAMDFHIAFTYNQSFKAGDRDRVQYFTMSLGLAWW